MTLEEYRRAVISTVACPYCLAEIDSECVVMPEPGARTVQVGYARYVHDDRSLAHLAVALLNENHHCQSCDGHACD